LPFTSTPDFNYEYARPFDGRAWSLIPARIAVDDNKTVHIRQRPEQAFPPSNHLAKSDCVARVYAVVAVEEEPLLERVLRSDVVLGGRIRRDGQASGLT
jgi:hypothetical protein